MVFRSTDWIPWCQLLDESSNEGRCEVSDVLDFTHPTHEICFKVTGKNLFGDVSSLPNETCDYLHDVSKFNLSNTVSLSTRPIHSVYFSRELARITEIMMGNSV